MTYFDEDERAEIEQPKARPEPPRQVEAAREQADEYASFAASGHVTAHKSGKKWDIPSLLLLDDDQLIEYQKLQHKLNQCDRWPDVEVPRRQIKRTEADGAVFETNIDGHTERGDFIQPYQKGGELISPPYEIQMALIFWGKDGYERFKAEGGRSSEIPLELRRMKRETDRRSTEDPFPDDGDGVVAAVSDGDRG